MAYSPELVRLPRGWAPFLVLQLVQRPPLVAMLSSRVHFFCAAIDDDAVAFADPHVAIAAEPVILGAVETSPFCHPFCR